MRRTLWALGLSLCSIGIMVCSGISLPNAKPAASAARLAVKSTEQPQPHFLPVRPLPSSRAERVRLAERLLKTSLSLKHDFPPGYGGDGDIAFFGEYAVLLNHAGEKKKARQILRDLIPKAVKESEGKDIANTQVSIGNEIVSGLYSSIHLCDALIWIARCQMEAGFSADAIATLTRARPLACKAPGNFLTRYAPAYVRELSPLTAIAVYLHRLDEKQGFQETIQLALQYAERLREQKSYAPKWEREYEEIALAYSHIGDRESAFRTLMNLSESDDRGYSLADAAIADILLRSVQMGDFSTTLKRLEQILKDFDYGLAIEALKETGHVEALRQLQSKYKYSEPWNQPYDLAIAYARRGNKQKAIVYARKVMNLRGKPDPKYSNYYDSLIQREMSLIKEIPSLPEASDLIQHNLGLAGKADMRATAYTYIAEAQAAMGDKMGAYRSYLKASKYGDDFTGEALNQFPSTIELALLQLGVVSTIHTSHYDPLAHQMEVGRELMKRLDVKRVEEIGRKAEAAWMLLGAAQVLLNRPALFVNEP